MTDSKEQDGPDGDPIEDARAEAPRYLPRGQKALTREEAVEALAHTRKVSYGQMLQAVHDGVVSEDEYYEAYPGARDLANMAVKAVEEMQRSVAQAADPVLEAIRQQTKRQQAALDAAVNAARIDTIAAAAGGRVLDEYNRISKLAQDSARLSREIVEVPPEITYEIGPNPEVLVLRDVHAALERVGALLEQSGTQIALQAQLAAASDEKLGALIKGMEDGSKSINRLTKVLIGFTVLLVVLTVALAWMTWVLVNRPGG